MYPCEHGDFLYNNLGYGYCRCRKGYEGVHCENRSQKHDDDHWWTNFFDSLRRLIWGPPQAEPQIPQSPQNTVNILVRPHVLQSSWTKNTPTMLTSTTTDMSHSDEANDLTFLVSFFTVILIIFCISCISIGICCYKLRQKRRNQQKSKPDASRSDRDTELASTGPRSNDQNRVIETILAENETQAPPSYEQAIGNCSKSS